MKLSYGTGIIALVSLMLLMIMGLNMPGSMDRVSMITTLLAASIYIFFIVAVFALWLSMLIDCLQRPTQLFPNRSDFDKLIWVIVIVFVHFFGAVLYYYLVFKKYPR
ncbi:MAG: PLDc N-terminal domain-containing protein [ANME-2 cluster archaeon]|nr:PLDc N-terminal domain-containing protein [ANME-2 cluster archaeon]